MANPAAIQPEHDAQSGVRVAETPTIAMPSARRARVVELVPSLQDRDGFLTHAGYVAMLTRRAASSRAERACYYLRPPKVPTF
jgi:hypothetical protein